MKIENIPIGAPTIIAGHNDGGKTALLDALRFLLDDYEFDEADRSYLPGSDGTRCATTTVEGRLILDAWEQETFHLAEEARVRRVADDEGTRWEYWAPVPTDERLRSLATTKAAALVTLTREFGLKPKSTRQADTRAALQAYAAEHSDGEDWLSAPRELKIRLPRPLMFDGNIADPDQTVKSTLEARYRAHVEDPEFQGRLADLENEVEERIRNESKSLCDHIQRRCPDLESVTVEPDVSFTHRLRGTNLQIARSSTGPVGLARSGKGSNRRVALAIWEWTSDLLAQQDATEPDPDQHGEPAPSPVQTIVLYDEPDTHLDYAHQRKLMKLIREQSDLPSVNVIVATHSMNLIDGVDIADVVHLKQVDGQTEVERLGTETHEEIDRFLGKIAASVGLRNSVLLHERLFMAVEGATELQAFPLLFRLSEGLSLQAAGIALWACDNNEGALHLAKYLAEHGREIKLVVDADSRNNKMFQVPNLQRAFGARYDEITRFVGESQHYNELEELFPDELWARVANERWARDTPWLAEDFRAHRGGKFSSGVQEMLQAASPNGPKGKPVMMADLALALRDANEVPQELRDVFEEARTLAEQ
ncbi:AAA family ATPase [Amycolatopsis sp. NPDC026612]|uniref:ATP-dependent nuclease n=1 Tax=Amycolatopsis sp. NPDC026612 TaxID=3155466 RepID=UPI0033CA25BF